MNENFTSDASEEGEGQEKEDGWKCEPPASFLPALEGFYTARKYLMRFDINDNKMTAISTIQNKCRGLSKKWSGSNLL